MKPPLPFLIFLGVCLLSAQGTALPAADFVLVDSGRAPAPIIVYADAPPRTRAAAVELADCGEKMCGRRPDVIDGEPRPLPERAVWVGFQPEIKALFPQTDFEFRHPEETLIVVGERHALVAGDAVKARQSMHGHLSNVYQYLIGFVQCPPERQETKKP